MQQLERELGTLPTNVLCFIDYILYTIKVRCTKAFSMYAFKTQFINSQIPPIKVSFCTVQLQLSAGVSVGSWFWPTKIPGDG